MKNRSVQLHWFLSFLILMLVPIVSIFFNYYYSRSALEQEYKSYYTTSLDSLGNHLDLKLDSLKSFYDYIRLDDYYNRIKAMEEKNNTFYYVSFHLFSDLTLYQGTTPELGWYLYNTHLDSPVTQNNFPYSPETDEPLYETSYKNEFYFYTEDNASFYLILRDSVRSRNNGMLHTFLSLGNKSFSTILNNLPDEIILAIECSEETIYFDKHGLLSINLENNEMSSNFLCFSADSNSSDIRYHYFINASVFSEKMQPIKRAFLLNLTITISLSIVLIFYLTKKNYSPVEQLLSKLNVPHTNQNEFLNLETHYNMLNSEIHSMASTLNKQKGTLISSWLLSVLKGRTSQQELLKQADFYNIHPNQTFGIIGILVDSENYDSSVYSELYFFILNNVFSELFGEFKHYRIDDGYFLYYIFALDSSPKEHWYEAALKKAQEFYEFVDSNFHLNITVIVGETTDSLYHTRYSYNKINELFLLRHLYENQKVIDIRDYSILLGEKQAANTIAERLYTAVQNKDVQEIWSSANIFFYSLENKSLHVQKLYVYEAFNSIVRLFNIYSSNTEHKMQLVQHIEPIMNASDFAQLKENFNDTLSYVCKTIITASHTENNVIVDKIKQYIILHYTDPNLSVNSVADALNKNPKYLSRIFKENEGIGILEYITSFRVSKAIEIASASEPIYNIAMLSELVGYSNTQAFRRAFIKIHGVTPSEYFKTYRE